VAFLDAGGVNPQKEEKEEAADEEEDDDEEEVPAEPEGKEPKEEL
jgi:hypothetical protein